MIKKIDIFLAIPLLIYLFLLIPYVNEYPFLDGATDFIQSYDFYTGGFDKYFKEWKTAIHPPLKIMIVSFSFQMFGISPFSYTFVGIIIGIFGIISFYLLAKNLFNIKIARIASLLLATSPMYIATSLFSMRDFILTVFIIVSSLFFTKEKYIYYAFFCSLAALTKPTALTFPIGVLLIEIIYTLISKRKKASIGKFIMLNSPLIFFALWSIFLTIKNQHHWNDAVFITSISSISFYNIYINVSIISSIFLSNITQLLFLNFNWIYYLIIISSIIWLIKHDNKYRKEITKNPTKSKFILIAITFITIYIFAVLTFPTLAIPRYSLPILPFTLLTLAFCLNSIFKENIIILTIKYSSLSTLIILSLFLSMDPLSILIWGQKEIFEQKIYNLKVNISGNNSMTYNYEFFKILKKRNELITTTSSNQITLTKYECDLIKNIPYNNSRVFEILRIKTKDISKC